MATANGLNANSAGLARYDGNGTWSGVTVTQHAVLVGAASNGITSLALGNAGQYLQSGGASADAVFSTATLPSVATGTGTILRADGTNWVATTSTYPNTNAINTLLYASSANVMAALATANNGVLITSAGGVPSISSTLPSAVQGNITAVGTVASGTFGGADYTAANFVSITNFTPNVGGSPTYSTQLGRYQQVGNLVFIRLRVTFTSGPTGGNINIAGLPFAAPNNALLACFSVYRSGGALTTANTQIFATMKQGVASIDMYQLNPATGTSSGLPQSATDDIIITGFYSAV